MRPPIYEPKGAAKEYGELELNIYTGCPHRCFYCFAPNVLHKEKEAFHQNIMPRACIVEEVKKQLDKEQITGKLIHLCFTCDPYPVGCDNTVTREIIKLLKEHGNHVQILTKGDGSRDFDLLDDEDWYGVTVSCGYPIDIVKEPGAVSATKRLLTLYEAKRRGIKTWVSFEPVLDPDFVLTTISEEHRAFDKVKIGKLNYHKSYIDWKKFGHDAEERCKALGLNYYIKDSLRAEME